MNSGFHDGRIMFILVMTAYSLIRGYQRSERTHCLHLQDRSEDWGSIFLRKVVITSCHITGFVVCDYEHRRPQFWRVFLRNLVFPMFWPWMSLQSKIPHHGGLINTNIACCHCFVSDRLPIVDVAMNPIASFVSAALKDVPISNFIHNWEAIVYIPPPDRAATGIPVHCNYCFN
jgi:hypothetical protein